MLLYFLIFFIPFFLSVKAREKLQNWRGRYILYPLPSGMQMCVLSLRGSLLLDRLSPHARVVSLHVDCVSVNVLPFYHILPNRCLFITRDYATYSCKLSRSSLAAIGVAGFVQDSPGSFFSRVTPATT